MKRINICHLTSIHPRNDSRIFFKECVSIAKNGFDITFIVADGLGDAVVDYVKIIDVGKSNNRFHRSQIVVLKILSRALSINADLYHFHDPELIPISIILRILGKKVIYDVHEDNVSSAKQKTYLPKILRIVIAHYMVLLDFIGRISFNVVIAEKYYEKRFRKSTKILNYPLNLGVKDLNRKFESKKLLYTGNVTKDRGAYLLADLVNYNNELEVYFVGRCSQNVADKIKKITGANYNRINIEGVGKHIPFTRIIEYYTIDNWLAGVAIFPFTEHYKDKELTKFFEYMAVGLPIISSDFPIWKRLIEKNEVGVTVNPCNAKAICKVIEELFNDKKRIFKISANGKRVSKEKYNWEVEEKKLLELYEKLLGES